VCELLLLLLLLLIWTRCILRGLLWQHCSFGKRRDYSNDKGRVAALTYLEMNPAWTRADRMRKAQRCAQRLRKPRHNAESARTARKLGKQWWRGVA